MRRGRSTGGGGPVGGFPRDRRGRGRARSGEVAERAASFDGLRVLGPNCLGLIVPRLGSTPASRVDAGRRTRGLRHAVGGTRDVDGRLGAGGADRLLPRHLAGKHARRRSRRPDRLPRPEPATHGRSSSTSRAITNPRKFMSAARAFTRSKPIVAYKAGRFPASAQATVSHTGAMAGEDDVYDAAFERAGIVRVDRIEDIFATAELLARERPPGGAAARNRHQRGRSGRHGRRRPARARAACWRSSPQTRIGRSPRPCPRSASVANPVDVLGDAPPERFGSAVAAAARGSRRRRCARDPDPTGDDRPHERGARRWSRRAAAAASRCWRPGWAGHRSSAGRRVLERGRRRRVRLSRAGRRGIHVPRRLRTQPRDPQRDAAGASRHASRLDRARVKELMATILSEGSEVLSETSSKSLLDAYEIPVTKPLPAASADDAAGGRRAASATRWCSRSARPTSRTRRTSAAWPPGSRRRRRSRAAYERILASVAERQPDARVRGVTVQPMVTTPGLRAPRSARARTRRFGAVILVGAGRRGRRGARRPDARACRP